MEYAIETQNLSKSYPGRMALKDVSFKVRKGSIHGFLGPNGAGKSTTMKVLAGLITQSSGSFSIDGRVGFLPEHPPVYPNMTVMDYLEFVQKITTVTAPKSIPHILNKTGLTNVQHRLIGNLSKGYQQRVGIAQALVGDAKIIILDEPTVGLDPVAIAEIRQLINELKNDHTILFSSHQLHDVELLCSDITLINQGRVIVSGKMDDILAGLKTQMTLIVRLKKFNDHDQEKLVKKYNLISLDKSFDGSEWEITLKASSKHDLRAEIAQDLVDGGLLEFYEERSDLEDLFKRITNE